jgi:DNA-directed RNA polymerase specialized sigma24 family protein
VRVDDPTLIERARHGSADALSTLYRRYWPLAWQWAYAVLRAFRSLRTFDPSRPFGPWLKRILLNLASDELRRLRRGEISDGWMDERRSAGTADATLESDELVEAVRSLAPSRRLVVVLHGFSNVLIL